MAGLCTLLLAAIIACCTKAQDTQCTERFMELSLLTYRAGQIPDGERLRTHLDDEIRLLPDITFTCPTVITSLALGIDVRREKYDRNEYPSVLVVRLTATGYTLLTEQTIYYTPDNVSTNGVYNYPLDPPISVNVGDTLGIRAPGDDESIVRIYYVFETGLDYETKILIGGLNQPGSITSEHLVLLYPTADNNACISSSSVINADIVHQRTLDINEVRTRTRRQYGYPDIKFSCNGTITKWIYGAKVLSSGTVQPELQIWRQTGLDTYTKIGFSSVTANATASPNVHEYYPNTTLQFQQGDVLGVYYPDEIHSNIEIYGQRGSGPHNYYKYLYYIDNAPSSLEISSLDISGNDFPLVSAVVSESSVTASQDSTSTMTTSYISMSTRPPHTTSTATQPRTTSTTVQPSHATEPLHTTSTKFNTASHTASTVPQPSQISTATQPLYTTSTSTQPSDIAAQANSTATQSLYTTSTSNIVIQPNATQSLSNAGRGVVIVTITIPSVTAGVIAIGLLILIPTVVLLKAKYTSKNSINDTSTDSDLSYKQYNDEGKNNLYYNPLYGGMNIYNQNLKVSGNPSYELTLIKVNKNQAYSLHSIETHDAIYEKPFGFITSQDATVTENIYY